MCRPKFDMKIDITAGFSFHAADLLGVVYFSKFIN
jgi:hypothetical protein